MRCRAETGNGARGAEPIPWHDRDRPTIGRRQGTWGTGPGARPASHNTYPDHLPQNPGKFLGKIDAFSQQVERRAVARRSAQAIAATEFRPSDLSEITRHSFQHGLSLATALIGERTQEFDTARQIVGKLRQYCRNPFEDCAGLRASVPATCRQAVPHQRQAGRLPQHASRGEPCRPPPWEGPYESLHQIVFAHVSSRLLPITDKRWSNPPIIWHRNWHRTSGDEPVLAVTDPGRPLLKAQ